MIENTLNGIIGFIGCMYIMALFFAEMNLKGLMTITITAFGMTMTTLLIGKFVFGVW